MVVCKLFRMPATRKVSTRQMEILIAFAEENMDLMDLMTNMALGRLSRGPQAHQATSRAWNAVANKLNAVADGVTKNADQWRRVS
jgi:hypothetical protein